MNSGEVMVKQLEKLVAEIERIGDDRLTKQTKRFTESLRNYFDEVNSVLKEILKSLKDLEEKKLIDESLRKIYKRKSEEEKEATEMPVRD